MSLKEMVELIVTNTYQFQQETQMMIKEMGNGRREYRNDELISPIYEELPS